MNYFINVMLLTYYVNRLTAIKYIDANRQRARVMVRLSSTGNIVAPNNLNKMIGLSGLRKTMVAELKGVKPATVSRHISGDIGMGLADAEEYAEILKCTPNEIFFANPAIPILGVVVIWNEATLKWKPEDCVAFGSLNGGDPTLNLASSFRSDRMQKYKNKAVYMHDYYVQNTGAIYWDLNDDLDHELGWKQNNLDIINLDPAIEKRVDPTCFGHHAVCMTQSNELLHGELYQSGKNRYSVESRHFGSHKDIKLKWACPVITMVLRPELRGLEWVDAEVNGLSCFT